MLPCNIIVQRYENGEVEVSAIDPTTAMQTVGNSNLTAVAAEARAEQIQALDGSPAI